MCAGGFASESMADEIETFFVVTHPLPNCARRIAQMTENMRANVKFLATIQASALSKPEFWDSIL
jgi:hypothetical protein